MIHLKTPSNFKYKRQLHSEKMRFGDIRFTIHKMGDMLSLTKNGTKKSWNVTTQDPNPWCTRMAQPTIPLPCPT